jgi:hypothetical protein
VDTSSLTHEYLSADGSWKPLTSLIDGSNDLKNGPNPYTGTGDLANMRWELPDDWTPWVRSIPLSNGTSAKVNGFFMRSVVTTVSPLSPALVPLTRTRCRSLGEDYSRGLYHKDNNSYSLVTFDAGIPTATDTVVKLINVNSAQEATFTIPANTYSSSDVPLRYLPLSRTLQLGPNDSLMMVFMSGGTVQDVALTLQ